MLIVILTSPKVIHRLDELCGSLLDKGFEVGVVLAGQDSDFVLRENRRLAECDLVYDVNEPHSQFTNFESSLYLANNPYITINADFAIDQIDRIYDLLRFSQTNLALDLIKCPHSSAILVTRRGLNRLKRLDDLVGLNDPRVRSAEVSEQLGTEHDLAFTERQKSL